MTPATALALVRRTRLRLEFMRLVRAASRGALAGTAGAVVFVILERLGSLAAPTAWMWSLPGVGACCAVVFALTQQHIEAVSAALFLDSRLVTNERFVTLWSNAQSPLAPRWAEEIGTELGTERSTPRIAWPREAGLAPVALFVLFLAGLLPALEVDASLVVLQEQSKSAGNEDLAGSAGSEGDGGKNADPDAAAKRLGEDRALTPQEVAAVRRASDDTFARPEDRRRAQKLLNAASGGDRSSAERLALALIEGAGALDESGADSGGGLKSAGGSETAAGARFASPYREEIEYLRAYQIELARLRETK